MQSCSAFQAKCKFYHSFIDYRLVGYLRQHGSWRTLLHSRLHAFSIHRPIGSRDSRNSHRCILFDAHTHTHTHVIANTNRGGKRQQIAFNHNKLHRAIKEENDGCNAATNHSTISFNFLFFPILFAETSLRQKLKQRNQTNEKVHVPKSILHMQPARKSEDLKLRSPDSVLWADEGSVAVLSHRSASACICAEREREKLEKLSRERIWHMCMYCIQAGMRFLLPPGKSIRHHPTTSGFLPTLMPTPATAAVDSPTRKDRCSFRGSGSFFFSLFFVMQFSLCCWCLLNRQW